MNKTSFKLIGKSSAATALALLAACSNAAQAASYTMYRDPQCGCCEAWADHVEHGMSAEISTVDRPDMAQLKDELVVPAELRSCHTMVVDGYVIEGHVPAEAIARLLEQRPEGVVGLAVPGMPIGSPGIEMGNRRQAYQVIAFGPAGRRVFASY